MSSVRQQKSEELRQQGNECVKGGNYTEAVVHYSHAIQEDPKNHLLYSNRSLTFLKLQQYYLAVEDARQAIKLQPKWPKGYFRKGEVEFQVGHYHSALLSYGHALVLDPSNAEVQQAISRTNDEISKQRKKAAREPWLYCGVGAFLGLLIVLADQFLTAKPSVQNVFLQLVLVLVFSGLGYGAMRVWRYLKDSESKSLLEPPVDLLQEMETTKSAKENDQSEDTDVTNNKQSEHRPHRKGGVSAARQRYKKGKS